MGALWDSITGTEKKRGDEFDRRLAELNAAKLDRGEWSSEQYDLAEQHRASGRILDPQADVFDAAIEGAKEGLDTVADTFNDTLNRVASSSVGFIWKAVPIWVWLIAIGYVAFQLGWMQKLLAKVRA